MEEMFIGTNSKGLVIGDVSVLSKALPQDQESRDKIVEQMVDGATATPFTETVDLTETVSISAAVEPELCI